MALTVGDPCLVASAVVGALQSNGSSTPIPFGTGGDGSGCYNWGGNLNGNPLFNREVAPGDPDNFGMNVQLTGKPPSFRGVVIAALQIELGTTGGTGALTQCVLVQAKDFRFLARAADVEEVSE